MQGVGLGTIVGVIIQAILNFVPGLGDIAASLGLTQIAGVPLAGAHAASGAIAGAVSGATSSGSAGTKAVGGLLSGGISSAIGSLLPLINGGSFDIMSLIGAALAGGVGGGILGGIIPGKK